MDVGLGSEVHGCTIRAVRHLFNDIWNAQLRWGGAGVLKGENAVVFPFWRCGMQYHDFVNFAEVLLLNI